MIVRIMGEGQRDLAAQHVAELNALDDALTDAVEAGDEAGFDRLLAALLGRVRELGVPEPDDLLSASDVILPAEGSSLADVRGLLGAQGLIPG